MLCSFVANTLLSYFSCCHSVGWWDYISLVIVLLISVKILTYKYYEYKHNKIFKQTKVYNLLLKALHPHTTHYAQAKS